MINIPAIGSLYPTFVSAVKALALYFVPYLIGFIVTGFSELRIWIALREAVPTPQPDETSNGNTRKKIWPNVIAVGLLSIPWILICSLPFWGIMRMMLVDDFWKFGVATLLSVLCNGLFFSTSRFVHQICGITKMAVHRTPNGGYMRCLHDRRSSWSHFIARVYINILSLLVVLGSTMTEDISIISISTSIASMALVHFVSGSSLAKSSMYHIIERYILALVAIASCIMLKELVYLYLKQDHEDVLRLFSLIWNRVLFVPTALCSIFSGSFIARMLRFDYQRRLDKSNNDGEETELVTVPAPAFNTFCYDKADLAEGILIPQRAPRAFYKPYFAVSLTVWSIAQITIFGLYMGGVFLKTTNPYVVCALALLLEFPVMVAVLLCFAAVKKEAKLLWNYQESWSLSPAGGAILLPSDNVAS